LVISFLRKTALLRSSTRFTA